MKDIALKDGHLVLENGDLKLVDGIERVAQQVVVGLKILKGDWFLDYRAGIDYINGLKAYPKILKSEIKKAMKEVVDVQEVRDYSFNKVGDEYHVGANVIADNSVFRVDEVYRL